MEPHATTPTHTHARDRQPTKQQKSNPMIDYVEYQEIRASNFHLDKGQVPEAIRDDTGL
jgi:hypothetical protein